MNPHDIDQPDLFGQPEPPPDQIVCCPTCRGRGTVLVDLSGKVGAKHPSTSRQARTVANRLQWKVDRAKVLTHLEQHGPSTAAEVSLTVGKSRNETAARLLECRELGHVTYAFDENGRAIRRRTSKHATGLVQAITDAGRRALAEAMEVQR